MTALEGTQYWSMSHNPDTRTVELYWKPDTSSMTGEDFKQALEHLAAHIRDQRATGTLIDVAIKPRGWPLAGRGPAGRRCTWRLACRRRCSRGPA